ncbi:MAG: carboxypeptidase-like regulatory domain-containing protein [Gemmataceae bacterium]|nr:carboxypeptidase-like regulatory domain-containing protein [Gemmataceae bacterium]
MNACWRRARLLVVGLALLVGVGCSKEIPVGEVEGTVRLGGAALANVAIEFLPDPEKNTNGPRSTAVTDAQGRYRLRCDDQRNGAVVGWHRIVLADTQEERPAQGQAPKSAPRIPIQYTTAAQTPLRKEVKVGTQTIDLDVTR